MFKMLLQSKVMLIIGAILLVSFIGFLALPNFAPEGRRLGTERLIRLVNVPVVSFAGEGEPFNLTADAIACSTGEIVASEADCGQFMQSQPNNCDGTIEAPVCGEDGVTYLNSCYAQADGVEYIEGMCASTAVDIEVFNDPDAQGDLNDTATEGEANAPDDPNSIAAGGGAETGAGITSNDAGSPVTFSSYDGLKVYGTFYQGSSKNAVVLLHMLGKDKSSYANFALKLQAAGFNVLAIDMRGHGQSRDTLQFETMAEQDFRNMQQDVYGAVKFLRGDKELNGKVFLVGASIGANTAINYGSVNAQPDHGTGLNAVNGVVALSPSFNYEGIVTQGVESSFSLPILTISSKGETQIHEDAVALHNAYNVEDKELIALDGSLHGTEFLLEVEQDIIAWLKAH